MNANLPSGTVTFLFTDIEGSTPLWEHEPDKMRVALERHNVLLRSAIEASGGQVFKTIGDAFLAAFAVPSQAVAAALAAQRDLAAEAWGTSQPLRVRMGLHVGHAETQGTDYAGAHTLNRVARIVSTGHGGQVLLSSEVAELSRGELPAEVTLRDMGQHRMKGMTHPEHLYQVLVPDLPADFPPLKTLDERPNNLPGQLTSFIGREHELDELQRLLASTRLLTLTGAGGTGKTRLALELAADLSGKYPDGVWLVELASVTDPQFVLRAIAAVLSVRESSDRPLLTSLLNVLRDKHLLLLLDNCEHLVDACAQFASEVLRSAAAVRILATSREGLGIAGELIFRTPSLQTPDLGDAADLADLSRYEAVRLFVERAAFALPAFTLTTTNAPAVRQICRRLDGIPLAIELAASRVKVLAPDKIAERLTDRFRLLTGGSRTALPRQQTLRGAIDWSYSLLTEAERTLLRRLSVFVGGWTLEACEAVCVGADIEVADILDLLTRLVDKSLVVTQADENGVSERYRMLETIRQYARERLADTDEGTAVRDKHLVHFVRLAELAEPALTGPLQVVWQARLDQELDNIRTALQWAHEGNVESGLRIAAALLKFWEAHGYHREACDWLSMLLKQQEEPAATIVRAKALRVQSYLTSEQGDFGHAALLAQESIALARQLGDLHAVATGLFFLGYAICWQDDIWKGRSLFSESLAIYRSLGDKLGVSETLGNLGSWGGFEDPEQTSAYLQESLSVFREIGHLAGIGNILTNLGVQAMHQGNFVSASTALEEGYAMQRLMGERGAVWSLFRLGELAYWQKNYAVARTHFEKCLTLCQESGRNALALLSVSRLGLVAIREGDLKQAHALLQTWTVRLEDAKLTAKHTAKHIIDACASLALAEGDPERAIRLYAWTTEHFRSAGRRRDPLDQTEADRELAVIRSQLDETSAASASAAGEAMTLEQAMAYALR